MTSFSELVALLTTAAITWKGIIIVFIVVMFGWRYHKFTSKQTSCRVRKRVRKWYGAWTYFQHFETHLHFLTQIPLTTRPATAACYALCQILSKFKKIMIKRKLHFLNNKTMSLKTPIHIKFANANFFNCNGFAPRGKVQVP